MEKIAYAYECLWCGTELGPEGVCPNTGCQAYPKGDSLHSHLEDRALCLDVWCHENSGFMDIQRQRACSYCENYADYDGVCDDDECPTHLLEFNPPEPGEATHGHTDALAPGHWMVQDGLLNEDGSLTPVGQQCESWVMQRLPTDMFPADFPSVATIPGAYDEPLRRMLTAAALWLRRNEESASQLAASPAPAELPLQLQSAVADALPRPSATAQCHYLLRAHTPAIAHHPWPEYLHMLRQQLAHQQQPETSQPHVCRCITEAVRSPDG